VISNGIPLLQVEGLKTYFHTEKVWFKRWSVWTFHVNRGEC
jgi:hypothetical protein